MRRIETTATQPLKVMRIMNGSVRNLTSTPIKASITRCTPHLVTSLNLTDLDSAFRTRLRLTSEHPSRRNLRRITRMCNILNGTLQIVALRTRPLVAKTAFPRRTEKSLTILRRTWFDKGRTYRCDLIHRCRTPRGSHTISTKRVHHTA